MKRILAISFYYLPSNAPRAIQVSRLIENSEHEFCLITGVPYEGKKRIKPKEIIVIPFKRNNLIRRIDFIADKFKLSFNRVPDPYVKWINDVEVYIHNNDIKLTDYDALITFGQPMSTHLLGVMLKKKYAIPWIAHFSDPWVDNPYLNLNFWSLRKNIKLEQGVFNLADRLIFTSEETLELISGKYPGLSYKMRYLPHISDPGLISSQDLRTENDKNKYIIRCVGNFYSRRSPEPLYMAVENLYNQDKEYFNGVEIGIAGSLGDHVLVPFKYKNASRIIKLYGKVDYMTSIRLMNEANCLIVIDAPAEKSIFFPSKLADYVSLRKYIAAITPEGTTKKIVDNIGGLSADPKDNKQVQDVIKKLILEKPQKVCYTEEYLPERVCARFNEILDESVDLISGP